MTVIDELVTKLTVDAGNFASGMRESRDEMQQTADKSEMLSHAMGAAAIGIGAIIAVVAGSVAALANLGSSFDDAYDHIRIATGATGERLENLKNDFRATSASVAGSFDEISLAIGDLNQRTGQTGPVLQELAGSVINLSHLTGTDLKSNIQLSTRMFGDWSIATEDQAGTLDKVYRASQATGAGVDGLMGKVVQFGAPMRQLGFSFEETVAMLGKWEQEGVNTELVMGSMRIAIGNLARDGIPLKEGMQDLITTIHDMEDPTAATALAMEKFGARAGPDMAAAIREGRFELGDLLSIIESGGDTIQGATEDTADFAEKWQMFTNQAAIALEPLATAAFNLAGDLLDRLSPAILGLIAAAAPFVAAVGEGMSGALDAFADAIEPAIQMVRNIAAAVQAFANDDGLDTVSAALQAVSAQILVTFGPQTQQLFDRFTQFVGDTFETLGRLFAGVGDSAEEGMGGIPAIVETVSGAINAFFDTVGPILEAIGELFGDVFGVIEDYVATFNNAMGNFETEGLDEVSSTIMALYTVIGQALGPEAQQFFLDMVQVVGEFSEAVMIFIDSTVAGVQSNWPLVQATIETVMSAIQAVIGAVLGAIGELWEANGQQIIRIATNAFQLIQDIIGTAFDNMGRVWRAALLALQGDWSGAWNEVQAIPGNVLGVVANIIGTTLDTIIQVVDIFSGNLLTKFGTMVNQVATAAIAIGQAIIDGIGQALDRGPAILGAKIADMATGLLNAAKRAIGAESPSTMFRDEVGAMITAGIAAGVDAGNPAVLASIGKMSQAMLTEAWSPAKADAFGQVGYDLVHKLGTAIESGSPQAIEAVGAVGTKIIATMKSTMPPEMAEEWSGKLIAAIGAGVRGDTSALAAIGELLDGIRDAMEQAQLDRAVNEMLNKMTAQFTTPERRNAVEMAVGQFMDAIDKAIDDGTPKSVEAVSKLGLGLLAKLKTTLPPEEAALWANTFMNQLDTSLRERTPDAEQAIREVTEAMGNRIRDFEHERHGEQLASALAEQISGPTSRDKLQMAGSIAMRALTDAINDESDKTVAAAQTAIGKVVDIIKTTISGPAGAAAAREYQAYMQDAFERGEPDLAASSQQYLNGLVESVERAKRETNGQVLVDNLLAPFVNPNSRDKFAQAATSFFTAFDTGVADGGEKSRAAVEASAKKVVDQWALTMNPQELYDKTVELTDMIKLAWETGDPQIIQAVKDLVQHTDDELRALQRTDAIELAVQRMADQVNPPDVQEKFRRGAESLLEAIGTGLDSASPQTIAKIGAMGTAMLGELKGKLPPIEAAAITKEFTDAMNAVLQGGGEEAITRLRDVTTRIKTTLGDPTIVTAAGTLMEQVTDKLADQTFAQRAGQGAAALMNAVSNNIANHTPEAVAKTAEAATKILGEWQQKLPPATFAARMAEMMRLLEAAISDGSEGSINALREFMLKMQTEANKGINVPVNITPGSNTSNVNQNLGGGNTSNTNQFGNTNSNVNPATGLPWPTNAGGGGGFGSAPGALPSTNALGQNMPLSAQGVGTGEGGGIAQPVNPTTNADPLLGAFASLASTGASMVNASSNLSMLMSMGITGTIAQQVSAAMAAARTNADWDAIVGYVSSRVQSGQMLGGMDPAQIEALQALRNMLTQMAARQSGGDAAMGVAASASSAGESRLEGASRVNNSSERGIRETIPVEMINIDDFDYAMTDAIQPIITTFEPLTLAQLQQAAKESGKREEEANEALSLAKTNWSNSVNALNDIRNQNEKDAGAQLLALNAAHDTTKDALMKEQEAAREAATAAAIASKDAGDIKAQVAAAAAQAALDAATKARQDAESAEKALQAQADIDAKARAEQSRQAEIAAQLAKDQIAQAEQQARIAEQAAIEAANAAKKQADFEAYQAKLAAEESERQRQEAAHAAQKQADFEAYQEARRQRQEAEAREREEAARREAERQRQLRREHEAAALAASLEGGFTLYAIRDRLTALVTVSYDQLTAIRALQQQRNNVNSVFTDDSIATISGSSESFMASPSTAGSMNSSARATDVDTLAAAMVRALHADPLVAELSESSLFNTLTTARQTGRFS